MFRLRLNKQIQNIIFKKALVTLGFFCFVASSFAQNHKLQLYEIVTDTIFNFKQIDVFTAYRFYNKGKNKKAYKILLKSENKKQYETNFFIGYLELEQRNYKKAIENFNTAIKIKPTANAFFYRALAYSKLNNFNTALSDYYNAIKLDTLMYAAYNNIALIKIENQGAGNLHQRDLEMSKTMLLKSIENEQYDKFVYFNLGLVCLSLNQFAEALTYFNKAIILDPYFDKAIYCRALTNYYMRSYANSLADFYTCKRLNYNTELSIEFITLIEKIIIALQR